MEQSFSEPSREAMSIARDFCRRRGYPAVGTEHLLLGLVRVQADPEFAAATGLLPEKIEAVIAHEQPPAEPLPADHPLPLSARMRRLLEAAMAVALERADDRIGTIHLFAAIRRLPVSGALRVLRALGVDPDQLPASIEKRCRTERASAIADPAEILRLSERMKPVLAAALVAAEEYHYERILPWHMLVGLVIAADDVSKDLMRRLGLTEATVRAEISRMIDEVAHGGG